jgi:hypothetical protein
VGEKARGKPNLLSKLDQPHGTLQAQATDLVADIFRFNRSLDGCFVNRVDWGNRRSSFGHSLNKRP